MPITKLLTTSLQSPAAMDFVVSWIAASHSFVSPAIYWMLNPKFRKAGRRFFIVAVSEACTTAFDLEWCFHVQMMCRPLPLGWDFDEESGDDGHGDGREAAREQHWGEILERSFSNRSLARDDRNGGTDDAVASAKDVPNASKDNDKEEEDRTPSSCARHGCSASNGATQMQSAT